MDKIKKFIKKEKKFIISLAIFMLGNAFMYWFLKLFQGTPTYINFYLDDKIPFLGWTIYIYDMFYPFTALALYLLYKKDKANYYKGVISGMIGCIICYIIFLIIPTIMYRPTIPEYDPLTNLVIKITYYFDEPPLNCFPSIHCVFCFQVIISYIKSKYPLKGKIIIITCAMLIVISTLLVKQHFIYDVISAFLVCLIANNLESIFNIYNKLKIKKIL